MGIDCRCRAPLRCLLCASVHPRFCRQWRLRCVGRESQDGSLDLSSLGLPAYLKALKDWGSLVMGSLDDRDKPSLIWRIVPAACHQARRVVVRDDDDWLVAGEWGCSDDAHHSHGSGWPRQRVVMSLDYWQVRFPSSCYSRNSIASSAITDQTSGTHTSSSSFILAPPSLPIRKQARPSYSHPSNFLDPSFHFVTSN